MPRRLLVTAVIAVVLVLAAAASLVLWVTGEDGERTNAFQAEVTLLKAIGIMDGGRGDLTEISNLGSGAGLTLSDSRLAEFNAKLDTVCDDVAPTSSDAATYAAYGCGLAEDVRENGSFKDLGGVESPGVWEVAAVGLLARAAAAADDDYARLGDLGEALTRAMQRFDEDAYDEGLDGLADAC